jgi:hypothetical protein
MLKMQPALLVADAADSLAALQGMDASELT